MPLPSSENSASSSEPAVLQNMLLGLAMGQGCFAPAAKNVACLGGPVHVFELRRRNVELAFCHSQVGISLYSSKALT